jgi:sugar phosphate isomerase/epimerase
MALPTLGVQLIVFGGKYNINTDTDAILDSIVRAGFSAVEGGASDAAMYKQKLDDRGLVFGGSHTGLAALEDITPIVSYLNTVKANDLCISGLRKWDNVDKDDYLHGIGVLNEAGRKLRDLGIHLHYHNHAFEFDKIDGDKRGIDLLIDGLNYDAVDLCVDVAWVMRGGDNPATFLKKHKDIIGYLHFKDFDDTDWAELGKGNVNFHEIMAVLPEMTKVRWVMAEQDQSKIDPMDSIAISRAYLKDTFGY